MVVHWDTVLQSCGRGVHYFSDDTSGQKCYFCPDQWFGRAKCTLEMKKHKAEHNTKCYRLTHTSRWRYSKTPVRGWPRGTWEHVQASPKIALAVILSEAIAVRKSPTDLRMTYSWARPLIGRALCHFLNSLFIAHSLGKLHEFPIFL